MTTLRTFVAVELDDELRMNLGLLQDGLRAQVPRRSVRWVRPEGIHLTLKFLGDTPASKVGDVAAAVGRAALGIPPFTIRMGGLGCFPNNRRPRVVWVGLQEETGALVGLRDAVEAEVSPLGFPTERRPFRPHLTLGRVQRRASKSQAREIGQAVAASATGTVDEMVVRAVCYIKSDLRPTGAVYTILLQAALGGAWGTLYVAVIGSASCDAEVGALARQVGREIASRGAVLICGGRGGVMEAACAGAKEVGGLTVGVLPGWDRGDANRHVDIAIATGLGEARNAIVVGTSDAVVALSGGHGTLSEIGLALKMGRPVVGLGMWELRHDGRAAAVVAQASTPAEAVEMALDLAGHGAWAGGEGG